MSTYLEQIASGSMPSPFLKDPTVCPLGLGNRLHFTRFGKWEKDEE